MSSKSDDSTPLASKTWQQTKSENTRTTILDAALECFYQLGYANTTTDNIAKAAGLSRGAMLHHFGSRFELIKAAVEHLSQQRLRDYAAAEAAVQDSAEPSHIDEGLDAYWGELNTPAFIVFHELLVASRTDTELREVLVPANRRYQKALLEASRQVFPDLAQSKSFEHANYLTQFLLEGMAIARLTGTSDIPEELMLNWLKNALRNDFKDVLNDD
ncbi:MAG: TetR/AcrR family transcriptional regulator [Pseudomonadales bacterium]